MGLPFSELNILVAKRAAIFWSSWKRLEIQPHYRRYIPVNKRPLSLTSWGVLSLITYEARTRLNACHIHVGHVSNMDTHWTCHGAFVNLLLLLYPCMHRTRLGQVCLLPKHILRDSRVFSSLSLSLFPKSSSFPNMVILCHEPCGLSFLWIIY